jgi:glycosyltransferase involved in cell wall biosynthesis
LKEFLKTRPGNPLVSIVVTIFNCEEYVSNCLKSITAQSYRNLEIIVVNDGSTDSSLSIVLDVQSRDSRVLVIDQENAGVSEARNAGIKSATGEFIAIVDGDDFVHNQYVEILLAPFLQGSFKGAISVGKFNSVGADAMMREESATYADDASYAIYSTQTALRMLFLQREITTSAWGKMYQKRLFDSILYPKDKTQEDLAVTYLLFALAQGVVVCDSRIYYYRRAKGGITSRSTVQTRFSGVGFAKSALDFTRIRYPSVSRAAEVRLFMECIYLISSAGSLGELRRIDSSIWEHVRATRKSVLREQHGRPIWIIFSVISLFGPTLLGIAAGAHRKASGIWNFIRRKA